MSSNIGQNYPYASETETERAVAVAQAFERFPELQKQVGAESIPLGEIDTDERWWVWICPADSSGRLHVAGYALDAHAMYTVCPEDGKTYLR